MTRVNLENNRARGLVLESAALFNSEVLAITAALTLVAGLPHVIMLDPASTGRTITLYTPVVTGLVHKHELLNISTGSGVLTLVQVDGTTQVALIPPGQRCELIWNPKTQLWNGYVQNSGQAGNQSVAAQQTFQQYTTLAALANAQVMSMAIPFAFKLNSVGFRTRVVASTAAKLATLTGQVNGASVTGGVISLTTANQNTSGLLTAGTAITAGNVGTAGQTVGVLLSAVTAFVEGDGYVEYNVTNTNLNA